MKPVASGQLSGWAKLSAEDRTAALEMARKEWGDDREWDSLPEHAKIWATFALPMVRKEPDRVLDTVACLTCHDSGFQPGRKYGVWFCFVCEKGLLLEAGHWRKVRFPEVRGRRIASTVGKREFEDYAFANPARAEKVKRAIAELVRREHEKADQETEP